MDSKESIRWVCSSSGLLIILGLAFGLLTGSIGSMHRHLDGVHVHSHAHAHLGTHFHGSSPGSTMGSAEHEPTEEDPQPTGRSLALGAEVTYPDSDHSILSYRLEPLSSVAAESSLGLASSQAISPATPRGPPLQLS